MFLVLKAMAKRLDAGSEILREIEIREEREGVTVTKVFRYAESQWLDPSIEGQGVAA